MKDQKRITAYDRRKNEERSEFYGEANIFHRDPRTSLRAGNVGEQRDDDQSRNYMLRFNEKVEKPLRHRHFSNLCVLLLFGCMTTQPRLLSGPDAAAYLGLTPTAFHKWVAEGRIPKPLPGTRRWDRKAIDLALDNASAIPSPSIASETEDDPFMEWKRNNEARKAAGLK